MQQHLPELFGGGTAQVPRDEVLYNMDYLRGSNKYSWPSGNLSAALRRGDWKLLLGLDLLH